MSEFKNAHKKGYVTFYNREGEIIGVFPYSKGRTYEEVRAIGDENLKNWEYYCEEDSELGSHRIGAPIHINMDTGEFSYIGFTFNVRQLIALANGYDDVIMTGRYNLDLRYKVDSIHSMMVPLSAKYHGDIIINMPEVKNSHGFYKPKHWLGYQDEDETNYYFEDYIVNKQTGDIQWRIPKEYNAYKTQKPVPDYNDAEELAMREKSLKIASDLISPGMAGEVTKLADEIDYYLKYGLKSR